MNKNSHLLIGLCFLLSIACQNNTPSSSSDRFNQEQLIQEVEASVWAFHAADTSRNAEKVISLMWPDCSLLIDGNRVSYQDVTEGSRAFMKSLELFHTEWNDLQIIPISENAAISSFIFQDSIINKSGELTQAQGPNTFLWQKRKDDWKILYVDADHYPVRLKE